MSWVMLKMFASVFGSIQVNLNHLADLHRVSQEVQFIKTYAYVDEMHFFYSQVM